VQRFDAVVVGSGFGGAVVACRLAEAGHAVLVLERGRRWAGEDFPRPGKPGSRWWFKQDLGLFELWRFPRMKVLVAAGVGGGSLVYTNVQKIPPASVFADWPVPISLDYLRPYYERVQAMLEPTPIPHRLDRSTAFEAAHQRIGLRARIERPSLAIRWEDPEREFVNRFGAAQQGCNLCGQCVFGCERHAKNTLDLNYLWRAEQLGAQVSPHCRVLGLRPVNRHYEVQFQRLLPEPATSTTSVEKVSAPTVFLAAGSLGTTELLLKSRPALPLLSPRLGQGWSANGDFFAGLIASRDPIEPSRGPSVALAYDASETDGFYVLEGAIPPIAATYKRAFVRLAHWLGWVRHFAERRHESAELAEGESCTDRESEELLRYLGVFFLMGQDASDGELRLGAEGELDLLWSRGASRPLLKRMQAYLRQLGRGYGGWMLTPRAWWMRGEGATVHPLGGCGMGARPTDGVADPFGQVFGYPGLYISDGSLIPRALGVPPSHTIAVLAEHVVEHALEGDSDQ
jgi:cholesterol oxidase